MGGVVLVLVPWCSLWCGLVGWLGSWCVPPLLSRPRWVWVGGMVGVVGAVRSVVAPSPSLSLPGWVWVCGVVFVVGVVVFPSVWVGVVVWVMVYPSLPLSSSVGVGG